jgi:hypothetical protein
MAHDGPFYEEDDRILGHAADPHHRIDIRRTSRHLVRDDLVFVSYDEMARIADLVSFEPDKVTFTIDAEKLEPVAGHAVLPHGPDRNLSVDEIGGIELVERATAATEWA